MRLKKIEMIGFKSFADKTTLEFIQGIIGIVGPNGCGKSNISDAFRWVLGEQSAKSIRGIKMNDLIFAGTAKRKPVNFAEVTLTLTDVQGDLPIDYDEVALTRRLYRSGESEYFINRQPVRLKDLQSLLFDSGIGKNAFSIFEQGKIDQVINYSPLERRYIFEEAAGIVRFLQRKREALKKLEHVDLNMTRVKDIHQEIEKQISILEEQAEKARIYKDKKSQLSSLEKGVLVAKWESLEKKKIDISRRREEKGTHLKETKNLFLLSERQLADAKSVLAEQEASLQAHKENVFKTRSRQEIKTREQESDQERLKDSLSKERKILQENEALQKSRLTRQTERDTLDKALKKNSLEIEMADKELKNQQEKVLSAERDVHLLREQVKKTQQERIKLVQTESQIESELKQNKVRLENTQERIIALQKRKEMLSQSTIDLGNQITDKQKQVRESSQTIDDQKQELIACEKQIKEVSTQIQEKQTTKERLQQEITEINARQKVLVRLREEMEGFSAGTKRLIQEAANEKSPLYQKLQGLHEHVASECGAEKAIGIALKPYMQTLVAKTNDDFQLVLEFAQQKKLKDFSLLCLETLPHSQPIEKANSKGCVALSSCVTENVLTQHFFKDVWMAKDLASALNASQQGVEILTEDGLFIDRHRVLFYSSQGENNIFVREAELKTLEKKLKSADISFQACAQEIKTLQDKKILLQTNHLDLDKTIRRSEMKLIEVNFALQRVTGDMEKTRHEDKQIDNDLKGLSVTLEKLTTATTQLTQNYEVAKEEAQKFLKLYSHFDKDLTQLIDSLTAHQRKQKDCETIYQKTIDQHNKQQHHLSLLDVKDQESLQQEKRLEDELRSGQELQRKIRENSLTVEKDLHYVEKTLAEVTALCHTLDQNVMKKKTTIEQLEKNRQESQDKISQLESERAQLDMQTEQCLTLHQNIETELLERYHLSLPDARRLYSPLEKTLEQSERQIRSLRQELEAAGDINMTSIEECEKHKVRHSFLNQQISDLNASKQELIHIITQLDKESRKIFKETFEKVCQNFKKNFKILFNGGDADLQFTETEDVLEAGIEIIVQPPGKQMRSINLLSGGEKCMTAMALLFAIFEVKPAPFCILDEIDAPLDDSNVQRFANVVKQFVDRCQFIIITHNKCTMAIADVLFGVSMEEKGVSKILSMELSESTSPQPILI